MIYYILQKQREAELQYRREVYGEDDDDILDNYWNDGK